MQGGGEDREDPWQRSTPGRSSLELPLRGASPDVHGVFEAGAITCSTGQKF